MKKYIIKFSESLYDKLRSHLLQNNNEQMCYLFCHMVVSRRSIIFLPRRIVVFSQCGDAIRKKPASVQLDHEIASELFMQFSESDYQGIINCHSHPFEQGNVWFSSTDDAGDCYDTQHIMQEVSKVKRHYRKNSHIFTASMVFGQKTVAARTYDLLSSSFIPVEKIITIGSQVRLIRPTNSLGKMRSEDYSGFVDRHVRAFGKPGQACLSQAKIAIVGVGGIGSILAEGVVRAGARSLVLVDPDRLDVTNLNRWQGAKHRDIGRYKVDVCRRNLLRFYPDITISISHEKIPTRYSINTIKDADVIFGGLDNVETRYVLNRVSLQYQIPLIDSGVVINSKRGKVVSILHRLGVIIPNITRCMDCSMIEYYSRDDVQYTLAADSMKHTLKSAGYIAGDNENIAPSVYPLNMQVASAALFELINLFSAYKPVYWNQCWDYLDMNSSKPKALNLLDHYENISPQCLTCNDYAGRGDSELTSLL